MSTPTPPRYDSFTMVLPVYREEARVARVIEYYRRFARLVVIDNFSGDRTCEIVRGLGVELVQYDNGGTSQTPAFFRHVASLVASDYVLFLSCSEFIPPTLLAAFDEIARARSADVVACAKEDYTAGRRFPRFWTEADIERLMNVRAVDVDAIRIHASFRPLAPDRLLRLPREERYTIVHLRDADAASLARKHAEYAAIEARDRLRDGRSVGLGFLLRSIYKEVRRYLRAARHRDRIALRETWARMVMHTITWWVAWELREDRGMAQSRRESERLWGELVEEQRAATSSAAGDPPAPA